MDKIIAERRFVRIIENRKIIATAKLYQLGGNPRPYFSVTGEVLEKYRGTDLFRRDPVVCGCIHETILEHWPELAPLVALHLSDDTGAPTHAAANAWYWMAGALGGMGERYHGGTGPDYSAKSPIECLEVFASYVRIPMSEAVRIANELAKLRAEGDRIRAERLEQLRREYGQHIKACDFPEWSDIGRWLRAPAQPDKAAREMLDTWIEAQRPIWQAQADAGLAFLRDTSAQ